MGRRRHFTSSGGLHCGPARVGGGAYGSTAKIDVLLHKGKMVMCAHVFLLTMPTGVGGTEVKVSKAGSYPDGKPEGDNSMTCKSLAARSGSYAVYG